MGRWQGTVSPVIEEEVETRELVARKWLCTKVMMCKVGLELGTEQGNSPAASSEHVPFPLWTCSFIP